MSSFDLRKLIIDVFNPEPGERVVVLCDVPREGISDSTEWQERRQMAEEWRRELVRLGRERGFSVARLVTYPATGAHNADLPEWGMQGGQRVRLADVLALSTLFLALTQFSATAPLSRLAKAHGDLRGASMPGVSRRMEETALSADYRTVARRCHVLATRLRRAVEARITFSTGDRVTFDLRYRRPHADDGRLHRQTKKDFPLLNLPSGEAFVVPYEGERGGEPSKTQGRIPAVINGEMMVFIVRRNRIVAVEGDGPQAAAQRAYFAVDPARTNIAELGLGCNDRAVVHGNILEDEKAGLHWAFGRSDHLGGTVGTDAFASPAYVVHYDIVYAVGHPIVAKRVVLVYKDGSQETIMKDGVYTLW